MPNSPVTSAGYGLAMDSIDAAVRNALVRAGDYLATRLEAAIAAKNKNATGELSRSIVVTMPIMTDHGWTVKIGPTSKHATFVIHGRAPGARMPPVEAIENWLIQRGIQVEIRDAKTQEEAIRNAAWAIAKSQQKNGIDPFPFITDVWKTERMTVRAMLRQDTRTSVKLIGRAIRKGGA